MALNYLEMAQVAAIFASILALWSLILYRKVKEWLPKKEAELLSKGEIWMGGAIGRFMQSLSDRATEEEGGSSSGVSPAGALELGGFKIDASLIQSIGGLLKLAQQFGFLKGGTGGGGENPFL